MTGVQVDPETLTPHLDNDTANARIAELEAPAEAGDK